MTDTLEKKEEKSCKFSCIYCEIETDNKTNYDKHLLTCKHQKNVTCFQNAEDLEEKENISCKTCNIIFNSKYNHKKHLLTSKHIKQENINNVKVSDYDCLCGKKYIHRQSLFIHKKKCEYLKKNAYNTEKAIQNITENDIANISDTKIKNKLISYLLTENQEFRQIMMDFMKKSQLQSQNPINNNTNINNTNSHNKQFNLNVFLNETCKDAMNMSEFIDSLVINNSELENMGKLGYIRGISNIFIRSINDIDEKKRPLHCIDIKREIIYIKDNNVWTKETTGNLKIKKIIQYIGDKSFRRIPKWRLDNPDSDDIMSKKNTDYMMIVEQVMTAINISDESETNKIIRNIANHICIDKREYSSEVIKRTK